MLSEISGQLVKKFPGKVWLRTGDLVWEIAVPFTWVEKLPSVGEKVRLSVCLLLHGEEPALFGFPNERYRETFRLLSALPRLGPRLALNILAFFDPEELEKVVREENVSALSRVPGIGPRRAERLCMELRAKLGIRKRPLERPPVYEEALVILKSLGFSSAEAESALSAVFEGEEDLDTLIRKTLKRLSPR